MNSLSMPGKANHKQTTTGKSKKHEEIIRGLGIVIFNIMAPGAKMIGRIRARFLKGVTLIEMLIVISLIAVCGVAVYSLLSDGLRVYSRIGAYTMNQEINIFFSRFSEDIRNTFVHKEIKFTGNSKRLTFASFVKNHASDKDSTALNYGQLRSVTYLFNPAKGTIGSIEKNYQEFASAGAGRELTLAKNIKNCRFEYYYYVPGEKQPVITSRAGTLPQAIKVTVDFILNNNQCSLSRIIEVPIRLYSTS